MVGRDSVETNPGARVGSTVGGKWRLDELLGIGAATAMYRATHRNGHEVAIRVLYGPAARHKDIRAEFARNQARVNEVKHPGILPILDDGRAEDGAPFVVMELLDGEDLEQRRVRLGGKLPVYEVLEFVDDLLDTLVAAHAHRVVHGGIRPEHLYYASDGRMLVLDFGLAEARAEAARALDDPTAEGPPEAQAEAFLAPEQLSGEAGDVDEQTDVWASGAAMFTLLTGRPAIEPADRGSHEPVRSVGSVDPTLDPAVVALVDKALQRDPKQRWPGVEDMGQALHEAYEKLYRRPMELPDPPPAQPSASGKAVGKGGAAPAAAGGATPRSAAASAVKSEPAKPKASTPPGPPPPKGSAAREPDVQAAGSAPAAATPAKAEPGAEAAKQEPPEAPAKPAAEQAPPKREAAALPAAAPDAGLSPPPRTLPLPHVAGLAVVALVIGGALGYAVAPSGQGAAATGANPACPDCSKVAPADCPSVAALPLPQPAATALPAAAAKATAKATAAATTARHKATAEPEGETPAPKATATAKADSPPADSDKFVPSDI